MKLSARTLILIGIILMGGSILLFLTLNERPLWIKILLALLFSAGMSFLSFGLGKPGTKSAEFFDALFPNPPLESENVESKLESSSDPENKTFQSEPESKVHSK